MASLTSLGLGKTLEKKLQSVGIYSAEELTEKVIYRNAKEVSVLPIPFFVPFIV